MSNAAGQVYGNYGMRVGKVAPPLAQPIQTGPGAPGSLHGPYTDDRQVPVGPVAVSANMDWVRGAWWFSVLGMDAPGFCTVWGRMSPTQQANVIRIYIQPRQLDAGPFFGMSGAPSDSDRAALIAHFAGPVAPILAALYHDGDGFLRNVSQWISVINAYCAWNATQQYPGFGSYLGGALGGVRPSGDAASDLLDAQHALAAQVALTAAADKRAKMYMATTALAAVAGIAAYAMKKPSKKR